MALQSTVQLAQNSRYGPRSGPMRAREWTFHGLRGATRLALSFVLATAAAGLLAQPRTVTLYEGARLIDGRGGAAIDNAAFLVENGRFTQVGRAGQLKAPEGATRVSLTGMTVMPAIIDTHTHLNTTRDALVQQLQGKAYYGVGLAMSLGTDPGDLAFTMRNEIIPNAARMRTAGRGITRPEPGRTDVPYWISTEEEGRKAVQELAARKVDLVKIWVDDRDGKYPKLTPPLYGAVIDEAHKHKLRVTAHIFSLEDAKGLLKAGLDAFAHGVRDKDIDDEFVAMVKARPNVVLVPNMPDRGVAVDMSWLSDGVPADELKKIQAGATDRPPAPADVGHPGPQPGQVERGGHEDRARHRRRHRVEPSRRDGRHGGGRHDAGAGDRRVHAQRRRVAARHRRRHD